MGLRLFVSGPGVISLDFGFNPYGGWNLHPSEGVDSYDADRMD